MTALGRILGLLDVLPPPITPVKPEPDPFHAGRVAEAEAAVAAERALNRPAGPGVPRHRPGPSLDPVVFGPGPAGRP